MQRNNRSRDCQFITRSLTVLSIGRNLCDSADRVQLSPSTTVTKSRHRTTIRRPGKIRATTVWLWHNLISPIMAMRVPGRGTSTNPIISGRCKHRLKMSRHLLHHLFIETVLRAQRKDRCTHFRTTINQTTHQPLSILERESQIPVLCTTMNQNNMNANHTRSQTMMATADDTRTHLVGLHNRSKRYIVPEHRLGMPCAGPRNEMRSCSFKRAMVMAIRQAVRPSNTIKSTETVSHGSMTTLRQLTAL